jgi:hypothetical protein
VKTSTKIALAFATLLSAPLVTYAQTEQPTPDHHHQVHRFHGPHHNVHHHVAADDPAPAAAPELAPAAAATMAPQAGPFGLSWPHIAPYPDGKGDEDGLSEDENDCNKGCIDGTSN